MPDSMVSVDLFDIIFEFRHIDLSFSEAFQERKHLLDTKQSELQSIQETIESLDVEETEMLTLLQTHKNNIAQCKTQAIESDADRMVRFSSIHQSLI